VNNFAIINQKPIRWGIKTSLKRLMKFELKDIKSCLEFLAIDLKRNRLKENYRILKPSPGKPFS
jgi:hypothetical protein